MSALQRVRTRASSLARALCRAVAQPATDRWSPHSRLFFVSDHPHWALASEARELSRLAARLGCTTAHPRWIECCRNQAVFYTSQFRLISARPIDTGHRLAVAYLHGRPGTGVAEFDALFAQFRRVHPRLHRIQVSHTAMRDVVLEAGVAPDKVFVIPLGINLEIFPPRTDDRRAQARADLDIPRSAAVVGSFMKDGVGWGEGLVAKLVKGPDVLIETLAAVRSAVPDLFVLLSGPARGYVREGLARLGIPYRHVFVRSHAVMAPLYHASDVCLVTSRDEGGPKAVMEAMASGVPVVTTRVGQAADLIRHGTHGWVATVDDVAALARWTVYALEQPSAAAEVTARARQLVERHTYDAQMPLWRRFFDGFVALRGGSSS